jgi:toxin ParE1/3/4
MAEILLSAKARSDLKNIYNYIADRSSEGQASKFLKTLERSMQQLGRSPGIGTRRDYLAPDLLGFPEGNYIIFYQATDKGIRIIRVLHGRRDIDNLF